MLDLKFIRENVATVRAGWAKKHAAINLDEILSLDEQKRTLQQKFESLQAEQNAAAKNLPKLTGADKEKSLAAMKQLKEDIKKIEPELKTATEKLNELLSYAPNIPLESVPEGKDDTENQVIKTHGDKTAFDFTPRDHVEIGKILDCIEIEKAVEMSGARFYYLKNDAVLLEFALVQFILHKLAKKGFTPVVPPVLVKESAMWSTGFFPADRQQIYHVNAEEDDLYLVGTAEVPLTMLHANEILNAEKLPQRYVGFSTCFRREAGTYGKDMHGILRVHQFDKIEMYSFCHPDKSEAEHEVIRETEEKILQDLGIPYQVVLICGGDLGAPAAKKYDLEGWIPSQNKYRELTSCSNCTDFQARRSKIRFKDGKESRLIHTLNGTACAIGRTLIAILENYQQKDGSVIVPKVLQSLMGKKKLTPGK